MIRVSSPGGGFDSKARAYLGTSQNINPSTYVKILLDSEDYDILSEFDSATNHRFTALSNGYYTFLGQVGYGAAEAAKFYFSLFYLNGVVHTYNLLQASSINGVYAHCGDAWDLDANDYVELYAYHNSAAAKQAAGASSITYLSIQRFG